MHFQHFPCCNLMLYKMYACCKDVENKKDNNEGTVRLYIPLVFKNEHKLHPFSLIT